MPMKRISRKMNVWKPLSSQIAVQVFAVALFFSVWGDIQGQTVSVD